MGEGGEDKEGRGAVRSKKEHNVAGRRGRVKSEGWKSNNREG